MRNISNILILILLTLEISFGQTIENNTNKYNLIDSLFEASVENNHIPAAVAYISIDGKEVYHKAFGSKNIESDSKLQKTDIFRIASMTKVVTAVAVMQLYERGLILLDDPISKYIPEFAKPEILIELNEDSSFTTKPAKGEITIRHLLTHTGGVGYGFQSEKYNALVVKNNITEGFEERPISLMDNTNRIASLPLLHEPGERFTYSLSYDILGSLVEVVSGEKLDNYFYDHIIIPLGMNDTYFYLPDEKAERLVSVYEYNNDKNGFIPTTYQFTEYPVRGAKMYLSGGADLSSTAKDISIFANMLLKKGTYNGVKVLGSRSVEMMKMKQTEHDWWDSFVGFALIITNENGAAKGPSSLGSFGWGGFYDTYCWVDPEYKLVAVLMLQMYPTNEFKIHERFASITYGVID